MIDQKTSYLHLPLPHPDNELKDDVLRLRDCLAGLDGAILALRGLVASDDVNLDTIQEIVMVLKGAQGDIGSITALLATKANKFEVVESMNAIQAALALKAAKADVNLQFSAVLATMAESASYVRNLKFSQ
ncbi:hypothetical protein [Massilia sp. YIM B04103]|uniref:hypothetical protein n=1 Tax=Massilia sp. YIM B04103 TaxID=2963106 RepID=UPI00210C6AEC|nr:hypothetical protein [Massilia sp. YIM B04103]